ncbi:MAG: hypothetical protein AB8G77_09970 [Rhodothermales bacterium]
MKNQSLYTKFNRTIGLGLLLAVFAFSGCDSSNAILDSQSDAVAPSVSTLTDQLQLTEKQANEIDELIAKRGENEPGTLWYVAAELQNTLTAQQKDELLASIETKMAERKAAIKEAGEKSDRKGRFQRGEAFENVVGDLTDEQKTALKTLRESQREEMKALVAKRREGSLDETAMKEAVSQLRESMEAELANILTEEQLAAMKAAREERGEGFRSRRNGNEEKRARRNAEGSEEGQRSGRFGRGEAREAFSEARIEALGLTSDQQDQMKALMAEQIEKAAAMFDELKASDGDREAMREKVSALRGASKEALNDILTEEQQEIIAIHRALAFEKMKSSTGEDGSRRGTGRLNRSKR